MRGSISNSADNGINRNCGGLLYGTPDELYSLLEPFRQIKGFKLTYDYYKEINKDWIEYNIDDIYYITEGSYINFPYYPIKNYMYEYYGENKYRLEEVKYKYDHYNIFNFKQSIK